MVRQQQKVDVLMNAQCTSRRDSLKVERTSPPETGSYYAAMADLELAM